MTDVPSGAVAVIFTSVRRGGVDADDAGYDEMAQRMAELSACQPGYLGVESVRDPATRRGITVSYWTDDASARAWKQVSEHLIAQERGRSRWYEAYSVVVAQVTRSYERG